MRHRLLSASLLLLAAACGAPPADGGSQLATLEQPIVNGVVSDATSDDSVVFLTSRWTGNAVACTGTLIAPNLVATALHCVTQTPSSACNGTERECFSCQPDGSLAEDSVLGHIGPLVEPGDVSIMVGSETVGVPPTAYGQHLVGSGSSQICRGDIAFVVLDRQLDAPSATVRLSYGVEAGDSVRVVGYGQTEVNGSSGRRQRSGVRVMDVGPASQDEPTISAAPRTFVVNEGPCHGDSGGPAFAEDTGALIGVYSLTSGDSCTGVGVRNVFTSLSLFSSVALEAFEAAGAEPILDEPPEPDSRPAVPAAGCALGQPAASGSSGASAAWALALAALGLVRRRRR
jgi:uncharacterized protein (TIGR03382 family)